MEERKFCMKSRAELDEIRKQQASKKASVNEELEDVIVLIKKEPRKSPNDPVQRNIHTVFKSDDPNKFKNDFKMNKTSFEKKDFDLQTLKDMANHIKNQDVLGTDYKNKLKKYLADNPEDASLIPTELVESKINEISADTFNSAMRKRIDNKLAAKQDVIDRPYSLNAKIDHKIASDKLDKFFDAADKRQARHKKAGWSDGNSTYTKPVPNKFTKIESLTASKALAMSKAILENTVPYAKGTTPNDLSNIWVVRAWVDNMDSEDGYDNIEFTKVGLIGWLNKEKDQEVEEFPETISDEDLIAEVDSGIVFIGDNQKVIEIRPYSTGFSESKINEISDETVNKVLAKRGEAIDKAYSKIRTKGSLDNAIRKAEKFSKLNQKRLERKYKSESKLNEISDELVDKVGQKRDDQWHKAMADHAEIGYQAHKKAGTDFTHKITPEQREIIDKEYTRLGGYEAGKKSSEAQRKMMKFDALYNKRQARKMGESKINEEDVVWHEKTFDGTKEGVRLTPEQAKQLENMMSKVYNIINVIENLDDNELGNLAGIQSQQGFDITGHDLIDFFKVELGLDIE